MIPRIAHFYWSSPGAIPWLREQSMLSFKRLHPDWEIVLGSPEERDVPMGIRWERDHVTDPRLPAAARSDAWRYHALSERGGVYVDTDVIMLRSVEDLFWGPHDAWITQDLGTVVPGTRTHLSIGVLAAQAGSAFFSRASALAQRTLPSGDYQSHGTSMLARSWVALARGVDLGAIPARAFYRNGSHEHHVAKLWGPEPREGFQAHEVGLHWYGGCPESAPFLRARSAEDLPRSWVRKALEAG